MKDDPVQGILFHSSRTIRFVRVEPLPKSAFAKNVYKTQSRAGSADTGLGNFLEAKIIDDLKRRFK